MPSSTGRALELLELLQSSGVRTVRELAERLGLDERNVRRHVERLRELGIPIESVRGRHGGYRLGRGYRMPPLMLTEQEATAALVALTAARGAESASAPVAASGTDALETSALETATAKLRRALPAALAERADALLEVASVDRGSSPHDRSGDVRAVDPGMLLTAADGIRDRRPLAIVYAGERAPSRRTLQPHDLVSYRGRWYLVGLDSLSREIRSFRLDRIRSVRALAGTFPEPPPREALAELVSRFASADYRWTVRLRIRSTPEQLRRHLPPSVATIEDERAADDDGADAPWLSVLIHAESLGWLPATLLALDRPVTVVGPDELREQILRASDRLAVMARGDPSGGDRTSQGQH